MRAARQWVLVLMIIFYLVVAARPVSATGATALAAEAPQRGNSRGPLLQIAALALTGPIACPPEGCAAGQRLSMRFDFEPSAFDPAQNPNIKVCIYAPASWGVNPADPSSVYTTGVGEVTGKLYTPPAASGCAEDTAKPGGYTLILERVTMLDANAFSDGLPFSFRLAAAATGNGRVLARLFENSAGTWTRSQQATSTTISVAPAGAVGYVANDATGCGSNAPCYINSADDLPGGLGTGLKDALDATQLNGTVYITGTYTIKSNMVELNRALLVTGLGSATITYSGPGSCTASMLSAGGGVIVRGLNINDGICTSAHRTLLETSGSVPVVIEYNTFTNGNTAILVRDTPGPVTIRFNNITGNGGFAIYVEGNTQNGPLEIVANNLHNNRSGPQVECAPGAAAPAENRKANHNYWGDVVLTGAETRCNMAPGKRLGMPIATRVNAAGVDAQLVTVTANKAYSFNNQIGYARSGNGGQDFDMYIVNHGYLSAGGPPFSFAQGLESPSPCSNYWDVFLPDGIQVNNSLDLFFKYEKTPACMAVINSTQYCDQTTSQAKYPLYWLDPASNATKGWDVTGARPEGLTSGDGQTTSCTIAANEIHLAVDNSGRPNLSDLAYLPFMAGVPVIKSFLPLASSGVITVTWTTNNEPEVQGFYVLRGPDAAHLSPITDLVPHTGNATTGRTYSYTDTGRSNGVVYAYRLQVVRTDGFSFYSNVFSVAANSPTITPTITPLPTFTATPIRPTSTPIPTRIPTRVPTRIPTATFIPQLLTPTATALLLQTLTPTVDPQIPGYQETMDALSSELTGTPGISTTSQSSGSPTGEGGTPGASLTPGGLDGTPTLTETPIGTEIAMLGSSTPGVTGTPGGAFVPGQPVTSPWLSLLLGLLAGAAVIGGASGLWYFWLRRM